MGGWWLAVIPLLLPAYYGLYVYDFRYSDMRGGRPAILTLALAFMFFIAFMFSNNMTIMLRPEVWLEYFTNNHGIVLNLGDPALYPRFLHFMTGALAVGGMFVALLGRWHKQEHYVKTGLRWVVRATVFNILLGLWFLMSLPREIMLQFMGGSPWATLSLAVSICGAGAILHFGIKGALIPSTLASVFTVLFMAVTRHFVRMFYLSPYFSVSDVPSTGQYSPMLMFIASLCVVLALAAWMIKLYVKAEGRS